MTVFTAEEIARATGGEIAGDPAAAAAGVSTDSRKVAPGELFVPLRGERFDGHDYIGAAAERGVSLFLAERSRKGSLDFPDGATIVFVDDTLRGLGDLAAFHRRRFDIPVVAVTGSNGKTTTKEMLGSILAETGSGLKTEGNLNNLIGLPLTLFRLDTTHHWAVLEMGMSEPGEIDRLAAIGSPCVGIVTNIFPAHLESMGSIENVAAAKGELFLRLAPGATAVGNADDPRVAALPVPEGVSRVSFGIDAGDVRASDIQSLGLQGERFLLRLPEREIAVELAAFGMHNVRNAVGAAAAARAVGVDPAVIAEGLRKFRPYQGRFRLEELAGIVLIDDCYNANPASMGAALATLRELAAGSPATAVLGDMLELGPESAALHRELGRTAAGAVDRLYVIGAMAAETAAGAVAAGLAADRVTVAATNEEIAADLRETAAGYVLVKGSRGMRMETIAAALRERFGTPGGGN
jgi:UDP-N-acetylmuramoyl-tripeptide--D-alanyl-D-alanine ligase